MHRSLSCRSMVMAAMHIVLSLSSCCRRLKRFSHSDAPRRKAHRIHRTPHHTSNQFSCFSSRLPLHATNMRNISGENSSSLCVPLMLMVDDSCSFLFTLLLETSWRERERVYQWDFSYSVQQMYGVKVKITCYQ